MNKFYRYAVQHSAYSNNTAPYTSRLVERVGLMFSVLTTGGEKRQKETLGGVGFVQYLDCGDGIMCVKLYTLYMCSFCISMIPQ